jgi:amino acid transporter
MLSQLGHSGLINGLINGHIVTQTELYVVIQPMNQPIPYGLGQSRVIREIARQGILPYPAIWVSTRPFGTPLVPVLLK